MGKEPYIPNIASGAAVPQAVRGQLQALLHAVEPNFPEGCDIVLMRPGGLEPVGTISVPRGGMLFYADPETAERLRPVFAQQIEQQRAEMARRGKVHVERVR